MSSLWPILAVENVDETLKFYVDKLGFEVDFSLQNEEEQTFFASVEFGESNIMFDIQQPLDIEPELRKKLRSEVIINLLLPDNMDIDRYYADIKAKDVNIIREIANQYWGNRDFTICDLNGYHIVFAAYKEAVSFEDLKDIARNQVDKS